MTKYRTIYCCGCERDVEARLTGASEIYPHRSDLYGLPFWICDKCKNYVGCHHKTKNRTEPLGNIPTSALRKARGHIHAILDPLWKDGLIDRGRLYSFIADRLGITEYHTANIKTIEDARKVYSVVRDIGRKIVV